MQDITPEDTQSLPNDTIFLDVRTPREFTDGHIEGAILIDIYNANFSSELEKLDKSKTYLVYCRTGNRSHTASAMMDQKGFKQVFNLEGGIFYWKRAGFSLV